MRHSTFFILSTLAIGACNSSPRNAQPDSTTAATAASASQKIDTAGIPTVMPESDTAGRWLDSALSDWNAAGASLPHAPALDVENPYAGRCARGVQLPHAAADSTVVRQGWTIVAPPEQTGRVRVVIGAANADGMCRPWQYQAFVFVGGQYAGTLSPHVMNSRTDGDLASLHLTDDSTIVVHFKRYTESDPLCCASRESAVTYRIDQSGHAVHIVPVRAETHPVPQS
jgi:hypothetical protein